MQNEVLIPGMIGMNPKTICQVKEATFHFSEIYEET
jgi:hypothetical protein